MSLVWDGDRGTLLGIKQTELCGHTSHSKPFDVTPAAGQLIECTMIQLSESMIAATTIATA